MGIPHPSHQQPSNEDANGEEILKGQVDTALGFLGLPPFPSQDTDT